MKVLIFYSVLMVALSVVAVGLLSYANELDTQCKQKGGTLLKTSDGLKCFDLSKKPID